mgnify:CR=1 FL=1
MNKTKSILFLICILLVSSCDFNQRRKEIMAEKVVELNKEMAYWDNLKQKVISDGGDRMKKLDKALQTELEKAGIYDISTGGAGYYEITLYEDFTFLYKKKDSTSSCFIDNHIGVFTYENNHIRLEPKIHQYQYCRIHNFDTRGLDTVLHEDDRFTINESFILTAYQNNLYLLPELPEYLSKFSIIPFFINAVNAQDDWEISKFKKSKDEKYIQNISIHISVFNKQ